MSVRFGIFADIHASKPESKFQRNYSARTCDDLCKGMSYFVKENADFAVSLGDILHTSDSVEAQYKDMTDMVKKFNSFGLPVHSVFGNHEFEQLNFNSVKEIFQIDKTFYSFDFKGYRFICLDSCFRPDGVHFSENNNDWREAILPEDQVEWLSELLKDKLPTVVFSHNNLHLDESEKNLICYMIQNHEQVMKLLNKSGCVKAVFQGHLHSYRYSEYKGIPVINIPAPIDSTEYSQEDFPLIELTEDILTYNGRIIKSYKHYY